MFWLLVFTTALKSIMNWTCWIVATVIVRRRENYEIDFRDEF